MYPSHHLEVSVLLLISTRQRKVALLIKYCTTNKFCNKLRPLPAINLLLIVASALPNRKETLQLSSSKVKMAFPQSIQNKYPTASLLGTFTPNTQAGVGRKGGDGDHCCLKPYQEVLCCLFFSSYSVWQRKETDYTALFGNSFFPWKTFNRLRAFR